MTLWKVRLTEKRCYDIWWKSSCLFFFSSAFPHLRDEEEDESTRELTTLPSCSAHRETGEWWAYWWMLGLVEGLKAQQRWHIRGRWGEFCSLKRAMRHKDVRESQTEFFIKLMQPLRARAWFTTELTYTSMFKEMCFTGVTKQNRNKILYWQKQKKACNDAGHSLASPLKLNPTHLWTCTFSH